MLHDLSRGWATATVVTGQPRLVTATIGDTNASVALIDTIPTLRRLATDLIAQLDAVETGG